VTETIEQLFRVDPVSDRLWLHGSRCRNCGEVLFPASRDCPACVQPDVMEDVDLVGHGTLRDYVVAERGPEEFPVPYVQSWVKLDHGARSCSRWWKPTSRARSTYLRTRQ
jgi:uncharacterized OB-fold protein